MPFNLREIGEGMPSRFFVFLKRLFEPPLHGMLF